MAELKCGVGRPKAAIGKLLAGLGVGLCFALGVTKVSSYDTWVHLSLGRWMFEEGRIPRTNLLSHTQPERATPNHQWLFQAGLYGVWRAVGLDGATLLKAGVVAGALGVVLATALRKGAEVAVAVLAVVVAAGAARFRFTLRPQVVALLFLGVYGLVLERWRWGGRRGLLVMLPLQVVWANVHGSAMLGCALALGYAVAETLSRRFGLKSAIGNRQSQLAWLWVVAGALVPLTLLNPQGAGILSLPFTHAAKQVGWGLKELLQDRAAVSWADLGGRHVCFAILGGVALVTLIGSAARRDLAEVGLCLGSLAAAGYSERFIDLFAVLAAPIAARNAAWLLRGVLRRMEPRLLAALGAAAALGLAALGKVASDREVPFGLGVAEGRFPEQEVAFVQEKFPDGNLFNEFEHGGYIWWRTRRPVFLDSRGELAYDMGFLRDYIEAWTSLAGWRGLVERHGLEVALAARRPLQAVIRADEGWEQVFQGSVCAVFVRRARSPALPAP